MRGIVAEIINTNNSQIPSQRNVVVVTVEKKVYIDCRNVEVLSTLKIGDVISFDRNAKVSKSNFLHADLQKMKSEKLWKAKRMKKAKRIRKEHRVNR